jgi:hypothetical protein
MLRNMLRNMRLRSVLLRREMLRVALQDVGKLADVGGFLGL